MAESTHHVAGRDASYFLLRRLHSLLGIVPVGVFLFMHLTTNASILGGSGEFQKAVTKIHELPALWAIEIFGIILPLTFHAIYGVKLAMESRNNVEHYPYWANTRYMLQRMTGMIAFIFIAYHLWQMHWLGAPLGGGRFVFEHDAASVASSVSTARAIQSSVWIAPFYALGIVASVFHLANGLWTALITWGITIRPATQRAAGYVCATFGIILGLVGLGAIYGFKNLDIAAIERSAQTVAMHPEASPGHAEP